MRTLPASINAQLANRNTELTLARCVKIRLRDGTEIGFTDLDEDVTVALDDDLGYPVNYSATEGLTMGDLVIQSGLDADTAQIIIPLGGSISRADVLNRRFSQADVWIFDIDHSQIAPQPGALAKGWIAESDIEEGKAVFEFRSLNDIWNTVIGSVLGPRCRADFGDSQCAAVPEEISTSVVAVTSAMEFQTNLGGYFADQYFLFGEVEFTSGILATAPPKEIFGYQASSGLVEVMDPFHAAPAVGDTLLIRRGCSKVKSSTDPLIPTCKSHQNVRRFRGFDRVPGSDVYLKVSVPGSAGS